MEWACENCGRTYHEPPTDVCRICGHGTVVPAADAHRDPWTDFLDRVRRAFLDPRSLDAGLASGGAAVTVAFKVLVAVSLAFGLVLLLTVLL